MKRRDPNTAGRAKYQQMWDVTAGVIKSWDPYGLLGGGAPGDEFDQEIASLVAQLPGPSFYGGDVLRGRQKAICCPGGARVDQLDGQMTKTENCPRKRGRSSGS
jgi:hypothetical protein